MDKGAQEGCGESARDDAVSGKKPACCVTFPPALSVKDVFNGMISQEISWGLFKQDILSLSILNTAPLEPPICCCNESVFRIGPDHLDFTLSIPTLYYDACTDLRLPFTLHLAPSPPFPFYCALSCSPHTSEEV